MGAEGPGVTPLPRCGAKAGMFYCTRPPGHAGDHVAGLGPWTDGDPVLARWRAGDDPARDDLALDTDGEPLPLSRAEVRARVVSMVDEGDVLAAIFRVASGDIAVQVFGPPSAELLDVLEAATRGYRAALERKGGEPGPKGKPA